MNVNRLRHLKKRCKDRLKNFENTAQVGRLEKNRHAAKEKANVLRTIIKELERIDD